MKCLLIEKTHSEICQVFSNVLDKCGCNTACFTDLEQAYKAFTRQPAKLVILTRLDKETLLFAKKIRAYDSGIAVIVGVYEEESPISLDDLLTTAVDDLIVPPFNDFGLTARIRLAVRRAESHTERLTIEQTLRTTDAKARAVLETTVDGIISVDDQGLIESFNLAAERIFGYKAEEAVGKNISMLMPPPYRDEHDNYIKSYQETGHRKIIGIGREVKGMRKNGEIFPMDLAVSEIKIDGKRSYTGIVRDISDRRELEKALLSISEQERRRIGQDLHDGLGQMLTGIGLIAQTLTRSLEARQAPEAPELHELVNLIREADQKARTLARTLVPLELETGGFKSAILRLSANIQRLYGLKCAIDAAGDLPVLDSQTSTHIYHIIQEAMNNAAKHSEADQVMVSLAGNVDQFRARIEDNGIGFSSPVNGRGMGLRIMQHRAAVIGANLEFRRGSKNGMVITCTLPLATAFKQTAES